MGGICGIINIEGEPVDEGVLRRMTDRLSHRGPDASSLLVQNEEGTSVGLGQRWFIPGSEGDAGRPLVTNEGGDRWIAWDGEIYNASELRAGLESRHTFSSPDDPEVVLHLSEEGDSEFPAALNGAFAFAVWDRSGCELTLARDRIGAKPLYYTLRGDEFVFASELKALLAHPRIERRLDLKSLSKYLAYEYVPAPNAILWGVNKLPAGSMLVLNRGRVTIRPYWEVSFSTADASGLDEQEVFTRVRELFFAAVERRLGGTDLPGIFLSGGIDSSALVAAACRLRSPKEIQTFTIGFREKSFDESGYARRIAEFFGTDHHEQILDINQAVDILPEIAQFLDEPFADASIIPTFLLCRFARTKVRVALGGDGGDEFFRGYPTFLAHRLALLYSRFPGALKRIAEGVVGRIPVSMANLSVDFKAKQFLKGIPYSPEIRNQVWLGAFTPEEQRALFQEETERELSGFNPYEDIEGYLERIGFPDLLDRISYLYIRTYLGDDGLVKTDRAANANSLGVRAPILDNELLDYVNSLPNRYKFRGAETKYVFKQALKGILPDDIIHRGKKGFGMPVSWWLQSDLKELMRDLLHPDRLSREGVFRPEHVNQLVEEHLAGKRDNRKYLWTLMMFQLWRNNFLD